MVAGLVAQRQADLARGLADEAQIDARTVERRTDGNEGDVGGQHGGTQIGRGAQLPSRMLLQQRFEPVLVNRRIAGVDAIDLARVDVHTDALMADLGEAHARDQAHIAGADDGDAHQASSASWLWWYQISERRRPSSTRIVGS